MKNAYKSLFPQAGRVTYLDTAAEGLPLAECGDALAGYFADKSMGSPGRRRFHDEEEACLSAVGQLLGTPSENVALVSCASHALNALASSIDWKPGDEVVISDLEFPSGVLAWLSLRPRGVTVRVLPSEGGLVPLESFQSVINKNTRVVCVSDVSYKTGTRLSFLRELSAAAHAVGAILVVDATQSLGRLPIAADGIDFLVASTYKWLLGVHGLSVVYLSPALRDRLVPGALGWYSVADVFTPDRFEHYDLKPGAGWLTPGMPAFPSIYVLRRSVEFLVEAGIDRIERELRPLIRALREGVAQMGFDLLTPAAAAHASGIVSFLHPECDRLGGALEQRGAIVWAGDGRVRASVHLYNDQADINNFLQSLAECQQEVSCTTQS